MVNDDFFLTDQLEVDGSFRLGRTFANDVVLVESPEGPKLKVPRQDGPLGLAMEQGKSGSILCCAYGASCARLAARRTSTVNASDQRRSTQENCLGGRGR